MQKDHLKLSILLFTFTSLFLSHVQPESDRQRKYEGTNEQIESDEVAPKAGDQIEAPVPRGRP